MAYFTYLSQCILLYIVLVHGFEYRQEMASVDYVNPRYVSNVSIFTSRKSRSSPYATSVNLTILHSWGHNVSGKLSFQGLKDKKMDTFEITVCNGLKWSWILDWYKAYTDVPVRECPIPAGSYHYFNLELPKNMPFLVTNSDYKITVAGFLTKSKELIMEVSIVFRFQKKRN